MSQAPATHQDAESAALAGQIDALLAGMQDSAATLAADQASAAIQAGLSADSPSIESLNAPGVSPTPALSTGDVDSLSSQIDALVAQVSASTSSTAGPSAPSPSTPAAASQPAQSVRSHDSLRDDDAHAPDAAILGITPESHHGQSVEHHAPDRHPPSTSVDLGELDRQLAAQASRSEPPPAAAPAPVSALLPVPNAAVQHLAPAVESAATLHAAPSSRLSATASALPTSALFEPAPPKISALTRIATTANGLGKRIKPAAAFALGLSSRTLEASPKLARDTAGWIGLVTVFFACCMWAIILFFRATPTPEVYGVASDVLEHGEPTPQGRPRPHAAEDAAAGGHGAPAADAHAAPAAAHGPPPAAKPAADAHGGGH